MVRAVVIGAGGYSGAELVEILRAHPKASIVGLFASARREKEAGTGRTLGETFPRFRAKGPDAELRPVSVPEVAALRPDAVFLATPHEASLELAPALRATEAVGAVFDLSGAFRLKDAALYPRFYGFEHREPAWLARAVYGLPEVFRADIARADLVAVPGCYPTSAIMPLRPLFGAGAVRPGTRVIVDSMSGMSGAGRGLSLGSLFCEVSVRAYNVLAHRHNPEIDAYAGGEVTFTPHVGPYTRGIHSTIHVELAPGWDAARVGETLHAAYAREPFVRLLPAGKWPAVADVERTNLCDVAWAADDRGHLVMCSVIDNLVKGAAGQAVQCMNIRLAASHDLRESMGLVGAGAVGGGA